VAEYALKEWGVTCDALARGEQVLIVRKGGIGEKRFELPHPRFFLFPTYEHQRPELVKASFREIFAETLATREDPDQLPLPAYAEIVDSHPIADPAALEAIDPLHILSPAYAAERLRWRRTQPLWVLVLRVWRLEPPPVLAVTAEHGGCVSWVELPGDLRAGAMTPALGDEAFALAAGRVADALAGVAAAR
jgi:hypothetical protein